MIACQWPDVAGTQYSGYNRFRFLVQSLHDLDEQLQQYGARLYVFYGQVLEVFTRLFEVEHPAVVVVTLFVIDLWLCILQFSGHMVRYASVFYGQVLEVFTRIFEVPFILYSIYDP
jgi:hypothetical protein